MSKIIIDCWVKGAGGGGGGGRCMTNISGDHGTINIGKSDTPGLNNNNYQLAMTG